MVAKLENVWMDEYDRVFEIELDNGLTKDFAEDSATKSAEMAVYYYGKLKLPSLKEELRLRSLKVGGKKMDLVCRLLQDDIEKRIAKRPIVITSSASSSCSVLKMMTRASARACMMRYQRAVLPARRSVRLRNL